ncbi:hypothetical protein IJH29_02515 [Candidatus Saccharibacteria bacterium]|nr:hypothetical protein [Candidatus Saccharibacteria bacterium]
MPKPKASGFPKISKSLVVVFASVIVIILGIFVVPAVIRNISENQTKATIESLPLSDPTVLENSSYEDLLSFEKSLAEIISTYQTNHAVRYEAFRQLLWVYVRTGQSIRADNLARELFSSAEKPSEKIQFLDSLYYEYYMAMGLENECQKLATELLKFAEENQLTNYAANYKREVEKYNGNPL